MKKFARFLTCAILCAAVASCGDDGGTNDDDDDDDGGNLLTASIDGVAFNASLAVQGSYTSNVLSFGGVTANARGVFIAIPNITATGTFDLGPTRQPVLTVNIGSQAWVTTSVGGSGTVTVSSLSATRATGSFSFIAAPATGSGAVGTKTVTNGVFDVTF